MVVPSPSSELAEDEKWQGALEIAISDDGLLASIDSVSLSTRARLLRLAESRESTHGSCERRLGQGVERRLLRWCKRVPGGEPTSDIVNELPSHA
jgi:hypothetical protein